MEIRDARPEDWPAIWAFMRPIVAAGDTYTFDPAMTEDQARAIWMHDAPGRTLVAADEDGTIVGTADIHPNQPAGGPGGHVANAGFMVDPAQAGRGVGRALAEYALEVARKDGFRAMQFNAVVETNVRAVALWRSLGFRVMATLPEAFRHPTEGYVGLHVMYQLL